MRRHGVGLTAILLVVLATVAVVYWPMLHGALVWDDLPCLRDQAWLRDEAAWSGIFSHHFCGWTNYFRPVAVAFFVFEARTFGVDPLPMHALSLLVHLANALMVGYAAAAFVGRAGASRNARLAIAACTLAYGLHPALIEPVAWISAQTELVLTFFMLLGLVLNLQVERAWLRTASVSTCFLLAACAKESAVAFPLALFSIDWMRARTAIDPRRSGAGHVLSTVWTRQWSVYCGLFTAGLIYLLLRWHALGYLVQESADHLSLAFVARLQEICYLYTRYWRTLVWPIGLNPVHFVDERQFAAENAAGILGDLVAITIAGGGALLLRNGKLLGGVIVVVTLLLAPALHIIPIAFDESLFHDRYVMAPLAFGMVLLPSGLMRSFPPAHSRTLSAAVAMLTIIWLLFAIFSVRTITPLWVDDIALWRWALHANPDATSPKENLLASYIAHSDSRTREFADSLIADSNPCPTCLLNVAYFSIGEHDAVRAAAALRRLQTTNAITRNRQLIQAFDIAVARLLELENDVAGAEDTYRRAISFIPDDPAAQLQLALFLARHGRMEEARRVEETALSFLPPEERPLTRREFEDELASQAHSAPR